MTLITSAAVVRHAIFIAADPERVWDGVATPEGLDAWFTTGARFSPEVGSPMEFRWDRWGPDRVTVTDTGLVVAAEPGRRWAFEWNSPPSLVDMAFEPADGGTVVRLTEQGFEATEEALARMLDCAAGWGEALTLLKLYVEHGISTKP